MKIRDKIRDAKVPTKASKMSSSTEKTIAVPMKTRIPMLIRTALLVVLSVSLFACDLSPDGSSDTLQQSSLVQNSVSPLATTSFNISDPMDVSASFVLSFGEFQTAPDVTLTTQNVGDFFGLDTTRAFLNYVLRRNDRDRDEVECSLSYDGPRRISLSSVTLPNNIPSVEVEVNITEIFTRECANNISPTGYYESVGLFDEIRNITIDGLALRVSGTGNSTLDRTHQLGSIVFPGEIEINGNITAAERAPVLSPTDYERIIYANALPAAGAELFTISALFYDSTANPFVISAIGDTPAVTDTTSPVGFDGTTGILNITSQANLVPDVYEYTITAMNSQGTDRGTIRLEISADNAPLINPFVVPPTAAALPLTQYADTTDPLTTEITLSFINPDIDNLNMATFTATIGDISYSLVKELTEVSQCRRQLQAGDISVTPSSPTITSLRVDLDIEEILTEECATGVSPVGYDMAFQPYDEIRDLSITNLQLEVAGTGNLTFDGVHSLGDVPIDGDFNITGSVMQRAPIFSQDTFTATLFTDTPAGTSILNISAQFADSYEISPVPATPSRAQPIVFDATDEINASADIMSVPPGPYSYNIRAMNDSGNAMATLTIELVEPRVFTMASYEFNTTTGQTGEVGMVNTTGNGPSGTSLVLTNADGTEYTAGLFTIDANGMLRTAAGQFLGVGTSDQAGNILSFQGANAPANYSLQLSIAGQGSRQETADILINVINIPYRKNIAYPPDPDNPVAQRGRLVSIYDNQYNVSYELVAGSDTSGGRLSVSPKGAISLAPNLAGRTGGSGLRTRYEEHTLRVREIIRTLDNPPQTLYGADNGTEFLVHLRPIQADRNDSLFINWWTKPDLNVAFEDRLLLSDSSGANILFQCPDPQTEDLPVYLSILLVNSTEAETCSTTRQVGSRFGFTSDRDIFNPGNCNAGPDITSTSIESAPAGTQSSVRYTDGVDYFITSFSPVNSTRDGGIGPSFEIAGPENNLCQQRGLRLQFTP